MPPTIALILCTALVLWFLRLERKQSPNVSLILWIPTIWMLSIASKPLSIWFGSAGNIDIGSPLDQLLQGGLLGMGLVILALRKSVRTNTIKDNLPLMLLIIYMFISIFWSDNLFISFRRWIRDMVVVVMAFIVLTEQSPRQALESLFKRTIYILIPFSVLLIRYFPYYGVEYNWSGYVSWIGVTMQKNGLGRLCLFAAFILIWTLIKRWQGRDIFVSRSHTLVDILTLIITLWLLKGPPGGYSATAITSLAVGLVAFSILLLMKKHQLYPGVNTLTIVMIFIICYGVFILYFHGSIISDVTSGLGRDDTLTGRTDIWAQLLPLVEQHPFWGSGFGHVRAALTDGGIHEPQAHSGYLDVLLDLGYVGLFFFLMFVLSSCRKAQRLLPHDFDWAALWLCFLFMAMVHNISESSLNSLSSPLIATLVFLAVVLPINSKSARRNLH